jgi:hypothetical protein
VKINVANVLENDGGFVNKLWKSKTLNPTAYRAMKKKILFADQIFFLYFTDFQDVIGANILIL